jgi:polyphosphate kinase
MVQLASVDPSRDGDSSADEPFDVEPPYQPDEEALATVTAYDDRFLDRELSWLAYSQRVLGQAEDDSLPLLERVRFAAIFCQNLDEFFMVRVAGLKRRIAADVAVRAASGLMPRDVLEKIWDETRVQMSWCRRSPRRASSWSAGTTSTARSSGCASGCSRSGCSPS